MQSGIFFELEVIFFSEYAPPLPYFFRGAVQMELAAFDLNELPDRFRAYIAMFNIYRILVSLQPNIPDITFGVGQTYDAVDCGGRVIRLLAIR